jgi:hypothetical protein
MSDPVAWIGPLGQLMPDAIYKAWAPSYPEEAKDYRALDYVQSVPPDAELDELVRQIKQNEIQWRGQRNKVADAIQSLRQEVSRMREDAERYRWLKVNPLTFGDGRYLMWKPDELDSAIDAARTRSPVLTAASP